MHKIYVDEGNFNFIYQIPQIIYSSLISNVINIIIKFLSLSEKHLIEIKEENILEKTKDTLRILKIKFALFFIVAFLFLIAFMYYITTFVEYISILKFI